MTNETETSERITHLSVGTENTLVEVSERDVYISVGDTHARRTPRQWIDLVKQETEPGPLGTLCCPVCGCDAPHHHTEDEAYLETVIRPAFAKWMFVRANDPCSSVGKFFVRGLWRAFDAKTARRDGGWAEQESYPDGAYKNQELEMAWQVFRAAWLGREQK